MTVRKIFVSTATALVLCLSELYAESNTHLAVSAPVRVAVLSAKKSNQAAPVADLLCLAVSTTPGLALLEREKVDALLAEHRLGLLAEGLGDRESLVKAGRLLDAEAILVLDTSTNAAAGDQYVSIVYTLTEPQCGLKLLTETLSVDKSKPDIEPKVAFIMERILPRLKRLRQQGEVFTLVGLMPPVSRQRDSRFDWIANALGQGMATRLAAYPSIALVDRDHTQALIKERTLVGDLPQAVLAAGLVVESSYETTGGDALQVFLTGRRNGQIVLDERVNGSIDRFSDLLDNCVRCVANAVAAQRVANPMHPLKEAELLIAAGQAYAAVALLPRNMEGTPEEQALFAVLSARLHQFAINPPAYPGRPIFLDNIGPDTILAAFQYYYRQINAVQLPPRPMIAFISERCIELGKGSSLDKAMNEIKVLLPSLIPLVRYDISHQQFLHHVATMLPLLRDDYRVCQQCLALARRTQTPAQVAEWSALASQMAVLFWDVYRKVNAAACDVYLACGAKVPINFLDMRVEDHKELSRKVMDSVWGYYQKNPSAGVSMAFGEANQMCNRLSLLFPDMPADTLAGYRLAWLDQMRQHPCALVRCAAEGTTAWFYVNKGPRQDKAKARQHFDRMWTIFEKELQNSLPTPPNEWVSATRSFNGSFYYLGEAILSTQEQRTNICKIARIHEMAKEYQWAAETYAMAGEKSKAAQARETHKERQAAQRVMSNLPPLTSRLPEKLDSCLTRRLLTRSDGVAAGLCPFARLVPGDIYFGIATCSGQVIRVSLQTLLPEPIVNVFPQMPPGKNAPGLGAFALVGRTVYCATRSGIIGKLDDRMVMTADEASGWAPWGHIYDLKPLDGKLFALISADRNVYHEPTGLAECDIQTGRCHLLAWQATTDHYRSDVDGLHILSIVPDPERKSLWVSINDFIDAQKGYGYSYKAWKLQYDPSTRQVIDVIPGFATFSKYASWPWFFQYGNIPTSLLNLRTKVVCTSFSALWPIAELRSYGDCFTAIVASPDIVGLDSSGAVRLARFGGRRPERLPGALFGSSPDQAAVDIMMAPQGLLVLTTNSLYLLEDFRDAPAARGQLEDAVFTPKAAPDSAAAQAWSKRCNQTEAFWKTGPGATWLRERSLETPTNLVLDCGNGTSMDFVWLAPLKMWVGRTEVTRSQFQSEGGRGDQGAGEDAQADLPMAGIGYGDWTRYCAGLQSNHAAQLPPGYEIRMPTEQEWQMCARCGDQRTYPWGNEWPPPAGNYGDKGNYRGGVSRLCPVSKSGTNSWGLLGMGGNVAEFCSSQNTCGGSAVDSHSNRLAISYSAPVFRPRDVDWIGVRLVIGPRLK